jgi:tRNA threonylcarbamoyladenosine biosynthesis protein TsaE
VSGSGAGSSEKRLAVSPILTANSLDIISHSLAQTRRLGARLGVRAQAGDLYCLEGSLGSGKTTFVQGLGEGLGVTVPVVSPTFVLVGVYRTAPGRPPLYHLDLYRISGPQEALDFGLEEYLYGEGVVAIEWPERIRELLPPERLWISFRRLGTTKRGLVMQPQGRSSAPTDRVAGAPQGRSSAPGARYEALVAELQREMYGGRD